jgi:hypothetical protein
MMFEKESEFTLNYKKLNARIDNLYWRKHNNWYLEFKKFDDEKFKEIEGYHGFYFISNYGQVISFHRKLPVGRRYDFIRGFFALRLSLMRKCEFHYIHDLVYSHFCKPLKPGYKVIHRNGTTTDNYFKNLTSTQFFPVFTRLKKKKLDFSLFYQVESESPLTVVNTIPVLQFDRKGHFIKEYPSLKIACIEAHVALSQMIFCLKNRHKTAGGYQWKYKSDFDYGTKDSNKKIGPVKYKKPIPNPHQRNIIKFDLDGNFIKEFNSIREAARVIGKRQHITIKRCADGKAYRAYGFQWRYKDDPIFLNGNYKIAPIARRRYQKKQPEQPVLQFSLQGKFIREYSSIGEALHHNKKISRISIKRCLKGKQNTTGDYQWRFKIKMPGKEGILNIAPVEMTTWKNRGLVLQFSREGKFIKEFSCINEAAKKTGISYDNINSYLRSSKGTAGGFQWRFKKDLHLDKSEPKIPSYRRAPNPNLQPVLQFDLKGNFIKEYQSVTGAAQTVKIRKGSLYACFCNVTKTAGGFQWKRKRELSKSNNCYKIDPVKKEISNRQKSVLQFDLNGKYIKEYPSIVEASRDINVSSPSISYAVRKKGTSGGFQWRYRDNTAFEKEIVDIQPFKTCKHFQAKPVIQFQLDGTFMKIFPSIEAAAKQVGGSMFGIGKCAAYQQKTSAGCQWRYKSDPLFKNGIRSIKPIKSIYPSKPALQFDLDGNFIKEYPSLKAASIAFDLDPISIRNCIKGKTKTAAGCQWKYKETIIKSNVHHGMMKMKIEPVAKIKWISHVEVLQFDQKGKFIQKFKNIKETSESLGISRYTIALCIRKKIKTSGGFQWRPIEDPRFKNGIIDIEAVQPKLYSNAKGVLQYTRDGNFVKEYHSVGEAARKIGITREYITKCANGESKTAGRFVWKYKKKRKLKMKEVKRGAG